MFFAAQQPYLCLGTLRQQLLYPDADAEAAAAASRGSASRFGDEQLLQVLRDVRLPLASAPGDLDRTDLCEGLSGGETQRLALARVLLRRPKFALLDECTNNCDEAFEGWFYERATRGLGITVLSISHKPSLQAYHPYRLSLDGRGGCCCLAPLRVGDQLIRRDT